MISRNTIKWIKSLHLKKYRDEERLFLVEGKKLVEELLVSDFEIHSIYSTQKMKVDCDFHLMDKVDLLRISSQKTPHESMAIAKYKKWTLPAKGLFIGLDGVRDPGNLGTIMRSANWFGADGIICSKDSVDRFNPKAVRASMGSIFRMPIVYKDLTDFTHKYKFEKYVLDLHGDSLYDSDLNKKNGLYIFGNEANGVSSEIMNEAHKKIKIPGGNGQESLNVSMAATILLSEVYRQS